MHDPAGRRAATQYMQRNLDRHDHPRIHAVLTEHGLEHATTDCDQALTEAATQHAHGRQHVRIVTYAPVRTASFGSGGNVTRCPGSPKDASSPPSST